MMMKTNKILMFLIFLFFCGNAFSQNFQILQYKSTTASTRNYSSLVNKKIISYNDSIKVIDSSYYKIISSLKADDEIPSDLFYKYFDSQEINNAKKICETNKSKDDSLFKFIAFLKNIPSSSSQKDMKLKYLKSLMDKDKPYYKNLEMISEAIDTIKIENSLNEFLTKLKQPKTFFLWNISRYDIDTINYYFSGQSKVAAFQNVSIQNFSGNPNISAELGTFYFGPLRLGVGGTFSLKSDTLPKRNIEKIINNGGNLNMNFSLPIAFHRDRKDKLHYGFYLQSNYGINAGFDSTSKQTDFSDNVLFQNQVGFNIHTDFGSNDSKARIFLNLPFYYVWGSKKTYQQLGILDHFVAKVQVGASLGDLIQFKLSGALWSSSKVVQTTPYILSLSFSPFNIQNR